VCVIILQRKRRLDLSMYLTENILSPLQKSITQMYVPTLQTEATSMDDRLDHWTNCQHISL